MSEGSMRVNSFTDGNLEFGDRGTRRVSEAGYEHTDDRRLGWRSRPLIPLCHPR